MVVSIPSGVAPPALLVLLADGQLHSGESLAQTLGQTRAAVWKGVERLRALGIEVQAQARRGYCLDGAVELLDAERMRRELRGAAAKRLRSLQLLFEVDSTNTHLMAAPSAPLGFADACLCELQSAGRGRLGRRWVAPFGAGITLSMNWSFSDGARALPALSLGVGVAVCRALKRGGAEGIGLKWPNDICHRDEKLGGVLIEIRAEAGGPAHVVIGVGINVALSSLVRRKIEAGARAAQVQPVGALADACRNVPSRNLIAGALLDELLTMLMEYEHSGFGTLREEWIGLDSLAGRAVSVLSGAKTFLGTARGVDHDGALLVQIGADVQRFVSGEASLRLAGDTC